MPDPCINMHLRFFRFMMKKKPDFLERGGNALGSCHRNSCLKLWFSLQPQHIFEPCEWHSASRADFLLSVCRCQSNYQGLQMSHSGNLTAEKHSSHRSLCNTFNKGRAGLHWIASVHLTSFIPYCRQGKGHMFPLQFFLLGKSEPKSAFDMKNVCFNSLVWRLPVNSRCCNKPALLFFIPSLEIVAVSSLIYLLTVWKRIDHSLA